MDREIPNSERREAKRNRILKISGIAVAVTAASDQIVGTAHIGTIDVTLSGTGAMNAAFEEIVPCPINSGIVEVYGLP